MIVKCVKIQRIHVHSYVGLEVEVFETYFTDWEDEPTPKKPKLSKSKTTPSKKGVRIMLKSGNAKVKKNHMISYIYSECLVITYMYSANLTIIVP